MFLEFNKYNYFYDVSLQNPEGGGGVGRPLAPRSYAQSCEIALHLIFLFMRCPSMKTDLIKSVFIFSSVSFSL